MAAFDDNANAIEQAREGGMMNIFYVGALFLLAAVAAAVAPTRAAECDMVKSMEMPTDSFWEIIEQTTGNKDQDSQEIALRKALDRISADDILGFELAFDAQFVRAESWDLWGAAYVANGGASDDGFAYFRYWLISRGHDAFEKVLANPDDLAEIVPADAENSLEFEAFAYVASELWVAKVGKDFDALNDIRREAANCRPLQSGPSGKPFAEDPEHLAKRYPKLWARFGDNPLF